MGQIDFFHFCTMGGVVCCLDGMNNIQNSYGRDFFLSLHRVNVECGIVLLGE